MGLLVLAPKGPRGLVPKPDPLHEVTVINSDFHVTQSKGLIIHVNNLEGLGWLRGSSMGVCEALCDMLVCKAYTNTFDLI